MDDKIRDFGEKTLTNRVLEQFFRERFLNFESEGSDRLSRETDLFIAFCPDFAVRFNGRIAECGQNVVVSLS